MKEQFATYEIALAIKELGFDEISRFGQETSLYNVKGNHTFYCNYGFMYSGLSDEYIYAPLWQQVIDWFKEKHNMYIEITYEGGLQKDTSLYSFQIWSNQTSNKSDKMNYYKAREQAILKAIELCQKKQL